ncbi:oxidoreductase [Enterococcus durans]|nr:oxidoreductase [Enterococcus durans]
MLLGLGGAFFYASGGPISGIHGSTIAKVAVTHSSERSDDGDLLKDPKKEVQLVASQTNDLKIDQETKKLYMTTDQGKQWRFVPLALDWVRFGDYTLTSGTIPVGYWMDKTFDLSPDFSWFLYSPDQQDVYMLTSTDAGKTWGKNLITNHGERVRYRKATFLNSDQGIVMLSTDNGMSAESLQIYTTNDKGKSWTSTGGTVIDQPIQNVSFVTTSLGFVSTREKLYYTANGGRSFKESIVTIPADYQTGGLDLFQSPNEVTQVSANKLEAKFYLLKANSIDIGKMFACLFTSTDNGETWQFEQQLSQVDIND